MADHEKYEQEDEDVNATTNGNRSLAVDNAETEGHFDPTDANVRFLRGPLDKHMTTEKPHKHEATISDKTASSHHEVIDKDDIFATSENSDSSQGSIKSVKLDVFSESSGRQDSEVYDPTLEMTEEEALAYAIQMSLLTEDVAKREEQQPGTVTLIQLESTEKGAKKEASTAPNEGETCVHRLSFQATVNKTYEELLSSSQSCVDAGLYSAAEKEFAAALRIACCEKEENEAKISHCLQCIGDVYRLSAAKSTDAETLVKSVALYNSALVRCKNADRRQPLVDSLKQVEKQFLEGILGEDAYQPVSPYALDLEHKMVLQSIRDTTREALDVLDDKFNPYSPDLTQQQRTNVEKERCIGIQAVFSEVHEALRQLVRKLLSECFDVLGNPPCGYAVIGLGSFARKEMTPYSDIEFAIIVEASSDDVKEFFINITRYLHIKVLNLGETILPSVGIKSLNDFYSDDPTASWFYDDGPRGLSFDGAMPWACKVPYGRRPTKNKPFDLDLVKTPEGMAQFQMEDRAAKEGYHLAEVMEQAALIAGDANLLEDYRDLVKSILDAPTDEGGLMRTVRTRRHLQGLRSDVEKFHTILHDLDMAGRMMQAKRDMHRLHSLIVAGLGLFHGCKSNSPWDIITELEQRGNIDSAAAHNIRVLVSIANEMRLRTYLDNDSQRDSFSSLPAFTPSATTSEEAGDEKNKKVYHLPTTEMIFRYFYTMRPLEETMRMFVEEIETSEKSDALHVRASMYDDGPICRALVHLHLLQFQEAKQTMYGALGKLDRYSNPDGACGILYHAGRICVELGLQEEARDCFKEALEIWPRTTSSTAHVQAQLLNAIGSTFDHDSATMRRYCEESLRVRKELFHGEVPHEEEAGTIQNIAVSWMKEGNYAEAEEAFSKALSVVNDSVPSPLAITILANMASCCSEMNLFEEACVHAQKAANMAKRLYGEDTAHPSLASALFSLGKIFSQRELHEDALACHNLALQIRSLLYGKDHPHQSRAQSLKAVAYSMLRLNLYEAAIQHYEEALDIRKSTEKQLYYDNETVSLLNLLGHAYALSGNLVKATEYQNEARKVSEAICSSREDVDQTEEMVDSLLYLAETHRMRNNYQQAIEFYKAFLDAKLQSPEFFSDSNVVTTLNNLGVSFMCLQEYAAAATFFTEALNTLRKAPYEKAGKAIFACVYNLGHVLYNLGNYQAARGHYEEIANKKRCGERETDDVDPVLILSYLAATYQKLGDHNRAIEMCQEALEIQKRDNAKGFPATLGKIHKLLGRSLLVAERFRDAITHLEKGLDFLQMPNLEEKTPLHEVAALYQEIAKAYSHTGQPISAADKFTKSLEVLRLIHGKDANDIDIAGTLFNLGNAFLDVSRTGVLFSKTYREKAALLYEEAVTMTRRLDYDLATRKLQVACLNNLGDLHFDSQDYAQAARFYEELSREITSLPVGTYSDLEASALFYNLGVCFKQSNEAKKAIDALERALEIKRLILDGEDGMYSIANTLHALGDSLFLDQRYTEAVKCLQEAMEKRRIILAERATLAMSSTLNSLGLALFYGGDKGKGIQHLEDAVRIRREILGAQHPKLAESLSNLGNMYNENGDAKEALRCYKEALGIWEENNGRDHPSTEVTTALYSIATAHARVGEQDVSNSYFRRTLHQIRSMVRSTGSIPSRLDNMALRTVSVLLKGDAHIEEHDDHHQELTDEMREVHQVLNVVTYLARYMTVTPPQEGDVDLVMVALLVTTAKKSIITDDVERVIAEKLTEHQGGVFLARYAIYLSTIAMSSPECAQQLCQDVVILRTAVWSLSSVGGEFCRQLAEGQLVTYLLTELVGLDDSRVHLSETLDLRMFLLTSATSILYNCARVQPIRPHFRHNEVSTLLMRHILDDDDVTIVRDVILTLAHISDNKDGSKIDTPSVREEVIQDFLATLEKSRKEISPEYSQKEMLLGLTYLAQNDENREKISKQKGVGLLERVLESDEEDVLDLAAHLLWRLLQ